MGANRKVYSVYTGGYNGVFDGAGYSISGLYDNSTEEACGFFEKVYEVQ